MKEVEILCTNAFEWLSALNKHIPSSLENNILKISKEGGSGSIQAIKLQEGFNATILDMTLTSPISFIRKPHPTNSHYVLNLFASNTVVVNNNKALNLDHYGISFYSAMTNNAYIVPSNKPLKAIILDCSKEWLLYNTNGSTNQNCIATIYDLLIHDQPVSKYDVLDYKYSKFLREVFKDKEAKSLLEVHIYALELISYFLKRLVEQNDKPELKTVNPSDLANIQLARQNIEENWTEYPTNEELARLSGMSLTKFNGLFKLVINLTPYQYHLKYKMDTAYTMLSEDKYSVSEVGNIIGYKNLSKFSAAFKKAHNFLPNQV